MHSPIHSGRPAGIAGPWLPLAAAVALVVFGSAWAEEGPLQKQAARRPRPVRPADAVEVGKPAPDFTLKSLDGKQTVTLSALHARRPVALVFGSYT